jgi:2-keto-4-pentenoate hydratase/2-oxohepta-3-ene-1,7-dioic acid hydratase in catechol pathway
MKIYRYRRGEVDSYGLLEEEYLVPIEGSIFKTFKRLKEKIPISEVVLLSPVTPSKIVAVGANYRDHVLERGRPIPKEPLLFLKPPSAVIGTGDAIVFPQMAGRIDYEGELALIIGEQARRLQSPEEAAQHILGYTCFNDVTARDLQDRDTQFTRAKSFDTFAAVGPCIATDVDPSGLHLKTFLNGKLRQSGNTRNLIFTVPFLVHFISQIMTLYPGDVITTGTPGGIGPMEPGDQVDVQIEGIGTLSNSVEKAK